MIRCRRNSCFIDAALLAARRLTSSDGLRPPAPPRPPAPSHLPDRPRPPAPSHPPAPPRPPLIMPFATAASSAATQGAAPMGRSIGPPGFGYFGAGALRYYSSKPSQGPRTERPKTPLEPPEKGVEEEVEKKKKKKKKKNKKKKKKPKTPPDAPRREPVRRPAIYGPALNIRGSSPHKLTLELAQKGVDCFGEADFFPKFEAVPFLQCNRMVMEQLVPGSRVQIRTFSMVPDNLKQLARSLPSLLALLHEADYCIDGDFTLDDFLISGQFKFFLKRHVPLVPCTPEGIDQNYARASKITLEMFVVSCGESVLPKIPVEMKKYIKLLECGGSTCKYLILTNVALLPMSSRGAVLRKFHDEILLVLPKGNEAIKKKILSEMNIRNWDKIAEDNKHLMDWYNYRGQKGMGKPYDPKKPAHFLSLLRNVDSHKYAKDFFVDGFIDRLLFACYPVQLSEMQEALWKYDRLGHLYIEENFNDGCAHITDAMPRCAPQTAQEPVASSSDDVIVYPKKKGETILKKSEVEHPAAKVLVELVELEDREVRDGPTSVVFIAAELIKRGNDRMTNKIHLTNTISGYRLAMHEACKYVEEKLAIEVDKLGKESLINCAKISMSSKLINSDSDFVVKLAVESVQAVKTTNGKGELKYPIESVNISKTRGKCRSAQVMLTRVTSARIACLDFNLEKTQKQVGVQVPVSDPRAQRESDTRKETIEKILKAGANVVLTTKGINNMSLKAGAIAVRHVRKEDLHRVAEATGATMVTTFVDKEGEETFDSSFLGYADEVVEERIADDAVILVKAQKIAYSLKMNPS